PAHHCFLAAGPTLSCGYALDLATGACFSPLSGGAASRARDAWSLLKHGGLTKSQKLGVFHAPRKGWEPPGMRMRGLVLDPGSGELCFHHFTGRHAFTPLADGRPAFQDVHLVDAQHRGGTLAVKVRHGGKVVLHLFRGPQWVPLAEHPLADSR